MRVFAPRGKMICLVATLLTALVVAGCDNNSSTSSASGPGPAGVATPLPCTPAATPTAQQTRYVSIDGSYCLNYPTGWDKNIPLAVFPPGGTIFTSLDKHNSFFIQPVSATLDNAKIVDLVKQYFTQTGISNITTVNDPTTVKIGAYTWTMDAGNTATQVNVLMKWTTYWLKTPDDFYIIIYALAPAASYAASDDAYFQPMLASIHISL